MAHRQGLLAVLLPDQAGEALRSSLTRLRADFGDRAYLAFTLHRRPDDAARLHVLAQAARAARVATVATGDLMYHVPQRHILQDVLTCIREGCTIEQAGFRLERTADRYLRPPEEMPRLFARHQDAVARTLEIVERCLFDLRELRYQYPAEIEDPALTPQQTLEKLSWEGAYLDGVPDDVAAQLQHELALIAELDYSPYFLTVNNIVRFARSKEILCQGVVPPPTRPSAMCSG